MFVIWVLPLPSAFITQISPSTLLSKADFLYAIFVPSGDQDADQTAIPSVSFLTPLPSAFIT
jgi:hypothetical protein